MRRRPRGGAAAFPGPTFPPPCYVMVAMPTVCAAFLATAEAAPATCSSAYHPRRDAPTIPMASSSRTPKLGSTSFDGATRTPPPASVTGTAWRAAGLLQGAGVGRLRRRAPDHGNPEGPEGPDLSAGRGPPPAAHRPRSARAEEASLSPGRGPGARTRPLRSADSGTAASPSSGSDPACTWWRPIERRAWSRAPGPAPACSLLRVPSSRLSTGEWGRWRERVSGTCWSVASPLPSWLLAQSEIAFSCGVF